MLELSKLGKTYEAPSGPLPILSGIDLQLQTGEALAIMGPSGSGKSTLLHIMGALDSPTEGSIALDNRPYADMKDSEQAAFRGEHVGFVFQDHSLLAQCSVLENVLVPTLIATKVEPFEERARTLLQTVGLQDRLDHLPAQLSGGEKQRVAIARALIREPKLLLCDEPTGNLDRKSADTVGSMLLNLAREQDAILVVVTHSSDLASKFPVRYELVERGLRKV